jgi:hypothetical protein
MSFCSNKYTATIFNIIITYENRIVLRKKKIQKCDCVISQHIQPNHRTSQIELNLAVSCLQLRLPLCSHPLLIEVNCFHQTWSLAIHWLTNPILIFALLFFVGPITPPILIKSLLNVIKNSKYWYGCTTTLPERLNDVTVNIANVRAH